MRNNIILLKLFTGKQKKNVSQCIVHCVQNKAPNETISSETKKKILAVHFNTIFPFPFPILP